MDLEAFELVILRSVADRPADDEQGARRLQGEHLAYLSWLQEAGHSVAAGPLGDQADAGLRGLVFYRTGSLDEARRLASGDPAVRAGRLEADLMTSYCPAGSMRLPGRAVHVPDE
jgi:uncharacterized protein